MKVLMSCPMLVSRRVHRSHSPSIQCIKWVLRLIFHFWCSSGGQQKNHGPLKWFCDHWVCFANHSWMNRLRTFIDKIRNQVLHVCCFVVWNALKINKQPYNLRSNDISTWLWNWNYFCIRASLAIACAIIEACRKHRTITNAIHLFTFHCFSKSRLTTQTGPDKNRARRSCQSEQIRFFFSFFPSESSTLKPGVTCNSEAAEQHSK